MQVRGEMCGPLPSQPVTSTQCGLGPDNTATVATLAFRVLSIFVILGPLSMGFGKFKFYMHFGNTILSEAEDTFPRNVFDT